MDIQSLGDHSLIGLSPAIVSQAREQFDALLTHLNKLQEIAHEEADSHVSLKSPEDS